MGRKVEIEEDSNQSLEEGSGGTSQLGTPGVEESSTE